jgi:hypothetical protein
MPRDPLKIRLISRLERLAVIPRIFHRRQEPEVAFRIPYNPVPTGSVHEECRRVPPDNERVLLLLSRFIHGGIYNPVVHPVPVKLLMDWLQQLFHFEISALLLRSLGRLFPGTLIQRSRFVGASDFSTCGY